jgi:hypothetical protein
MRGFVCEHVFVFGRVIMLLTSRVLDSCRRRLTVVVHDDIYDSLMQREIRTIIKQAMPS